MGVDVYRRGSGCPEAWLVQNGVHRPGGPHHYEERRREEPDAVCGAERIYWCRRCGRTVSELPPPPPCDVKGALPPRVPVPCERWHCQHPLRDPADPNKDAGVHLGWCCRCKAILQLVPGLEYEEKSHGMCVSGEPPHYVVLQDPRRPA